MTKKSVVALSAPQKSYHPSPVQDSKDAVPEAYCADLRCTPQAGMGKNVETAQCSELCGERKMSFWCATLERSDLSYIGTGEGSEQAATGGEAIEGDEASAEKREPFGFSVHYRKTSRLIPATPVATEARRGEARRAAVEERAWMSLLFP